MNKPLTPNQKRVLLLMREGAVIQGFALVSGDVKVGRITEPGIRRLVEAKLIKATGFLSHTYVLTDKGRETPIDGPVYRSHAFQN